MKAGELDQLVIIQSPTETRDAGGAVVVTWDDLVTAWAAIEPLRGRELIAAQAEASEISGKIRMRYVDGVTSKCRVVHGGKIYDILAAVNPKTRGEALELYVREGPNEG